ncbi:MAG: lamin tail domain-containing protein [Candidatus Wildermuthbacteria bacterium]|nr:lamin tail domain-containing protein [Candidatus Wildermuthbacteria bacterium]
MQYVAFFFSLLFGAPLFVSAELGDVVINEIVWMGSPVEGVEQKQWWRYEWLELYNSAEQQVSLAGWAVELSRDQLDFRIPLAGNIPAQGYFLIVSSDKIANFDLSYENLTGKFVNTGQNVVLKNAQGEIVDEIDAAGGWYGGDNETKFSMERRNPSEPGTDAKNWGTSIVRVGTPRSQNSIFGTDILALQEQTKKDFQQSSSVPTNTSPLFVALSLALVSAAGILALKRFLDSRRNANSSDALQD